MTIEQEQRCAIEALSRASDVTQRLMFREGAKWMDSEHAAFAAEACKVVGEEWKAIHDKAVSEHAAALAKAEERCRVLEELVKSAFIEGTRCGYSAAMGNVLEQNVESDWLISRARAALEGK